MTEIEFGRSEIKSLAEKLSQDNPQLDDYDRRRFLAIFSAASQAESLAAAEPTLLELKSQLTDAFIPGEDNEFIIVCRIGVPPTWPPASGPTHPTPFPPPTAPPYPSEGSTPEPGQE